MSFLKEHINLVKCPKFLPDNVHYEVIMGSMAYGVNTDSSDMDIYGFCIPPKDDIFPHLRGEIPGFGRQKQRFESWQQHHVEDRDKGRMYDFSIYSIVTFFNLLMENNPNIIDSLFVPNNCVLSSTHIGNMVRENRKLFLHKGSYHKFKGYAYSQLHKMKSQTREGKRKEVVEKFGYDIKFAYHVVRLAEEAAMILEYQDLDLQKNNEMLKSIRRGEWTVSDIEEYFDRAEKRLEKLYDESLLRNEPDENAIKALLLNCLEEHYGDLSKVIYNPDKYKTAVDEIRRILDNV